jgi:hypothetical protein
MMGATSAGSTWPKVLRISPDGSADPSARAAKPPSAVRKMANGKSARKKR